MNKKKLLFIVEGEKSEMKFLEKMFDIFFKKQNYECYSYNANIHMLIDNLFYNNVLDTNLNLLTHLATLEKDLAKKLILNDTYSDVLLIFDFDPHHNDPNIDFKKIKVLLDFFNDSANNGKLYINYPMLESYKHLKSLPDNDFKDSTITLSNCSKYKDIVNSESFNTNINKYNYITFSNIIIHHLKKANYIIDKQYNIPSYDDFLNWSNSYLYDIQYNFMTSKQMFYILNTSLFYPFEYYGNTLFKHSDILLH